MSVRLNILDTFNKALKTELLIVQIKYSRYFEESKKSFFGCRTRIAENSRKPPELQTFLLVLVWLEVRKVYQLLMLFIPKIEYIYV